MQMQHTIYNCMLRHRSNGMVDKKTKFVLSLQGKEYAGHLDHWSVTGGDLAGLIAST